MLLSRLNLSARLLELTYACADGRRSLSRFCTSLLALAVYSLTVSTGQAEDRVDFNRDIRPILSNNCLRCHGPDDATREADLRLDTFAGATAEISNGQAIVPGHADQSVAIARIESTDPGERMPPPDSQQSLTPKQIELLKRWINQGAEYQSHWAFQPLRLRAVERVSDPTWAQLPIDHFVQEELDKHHIKPAPPAEREVLLRRLSLDLRGLPPTADEVRDFSEDDRPDALERQIDRMLASPRYGERWGRHWLDQARYADSNGYTVDSDRSIWPYRDWVIRAVNDDLPFDQFTIDQLAGDLLDNPTTAQLVATGFHRNTLVNQEGGTDPEQFRNEAVVDRVNTTGAVWMGLTVGCAQCHNHKYDPFSQREFYQLFAFFNSDEDVNSVAPTMPLPTPAQATELDRIESEIKLVTYAIAQLEQADKLFSHSKADPSKAANTKAESKASESKASQSKASESKASESKGSETEGREYAAGAAQWHSVKPQAVKSNRGTEFESLKDGSWLAAGTADSNQTGEEYVIDLDTELSRLTALRLDALTHAGLPNKGPGRAKNGNFVLTQIELKINGQAATWTAAAADFSQDNYGVSNAIDGDPKTGWAINGDKASGGGNIDHHAMFYLAPLDLPTDAKLQVVLKFADKPAGYSLGRFQIHLSDNARREARPTDRTTPVQDLANHLKELQEHQKIVQRKLVSSMVMRSLAKPRDSFIHVRGDFLRHGDPVVADVPTAVPPAISKSDAQRPATRLELAEWLVSPDNPLVSRVIANRSWNHFFPLGLVETENDFGIQGTPPSHPALLDWLAIELRDNGWSMKRLHRQIVSSATYQQSSDFRQDLVTVDPSNKLLARQTRLRVEAEIVRDCGLQASGLIDTKIGGPSVYPPQPDGVYAFTQNKSAWPTSLGGDRFRRGIYTFFRRSAPYPMLTTFDTPRFDTTCTRRIRSNTPLQSLTLANDTAMLEVATALGRTLWEQTGTPEERMVTAFEACLSRRPNEDESRSLLEYWRAQMTELAADPSATAALLSALSKQPGWNQAVSGDAGLDAERAAWVMVARVIMNLDEFVTRE